MFSGSIMHMPCLFDHLEDQIKPFSLSWKVVQACFGTRNVLKLIFDDSRSRAMLVNARFSGQLLR